MLKRLKSRTCIKYISVFAAAIISVLLLWSLGEATAQAKTIVIKTPEEFVNINWGYKGFGPGNTYVLGNSFTLSDTQEESCLLTKGSFVIDFNGYTVQSASASKATFQIRGANVVFKDSRVNENTPSVRSYGIGTIDITKGTLEIKSGNYLGDGGGGDSSALYVGGGVCVVNGGVFVGYTYGAVAAGGSLFINNNAGFRAACYQGLYDISGKSNIKISTATVIGGQKGFALGALTMGNYYDFNKWLANGSSYSTDVQTIYWNMSTQYNLTPSQYFSTAVSYDGYNAIGQLQVTSSTNKPVGLEYLPKASQGNKPAQTTLGKLKSKKKKTLTVKWKKISGVSGYEIQLARNKRFTKGLKTVTVKKANKTSRTVKKLKSKKTYFVRIRTFKTSGKNKSYSDWSKVKKFKVK